MNKDPILCYVDEPWAYFTTQDLDKQWGDDWNDAPYEHNAGTPYEPCWHNDPGALNIHRACAKPGELCKCELCVRDWDMYEGAQPRCLPKWQITRVAYTGDLYTPCTSTGNSKYSVEDINTGACAWLWTPQWAQSSITITAGTPLSQFTELIRKAGGDVYTIQR